MYQGKIIEGSCNTNDKRIAKTIETSRRHELALGTAGIKPKRKVPLFKDYAVNVFLPEVRINSAETPATITYYKNSIGNLLKSPLADKPLDEIAIADVTQHKGVMQKAGYTVSTINASLRALKRILNVACEADIIPKVCKITQLDGQNTRDFVLSYEDEIEYLAASDPLNRQVATMMLEMGFRPEEIHRLEWSQIHSDSIIIYDGKGEGSRRRVATSPAALSVLKERGLLDASSRESQQYVFPTKSRTGEVIPIDHSSTKKQHTKAVKAVREAKAARVGKFEDEIDFDFVPYSLRHTFVTRLAETGIDAPALMYIAGHRNLATTMKYIHLASVSVNERLRDARQKQLTARVSRSGGGNMVAVLTLGTEDAE